MKNNIYLVFMFILFFSFSFDANGQRVQNKNYNFNGWIATTGVIQLENGETLEGYIVLPLPTSGKLTYVTSDQAKTQKIKINDVESVLLNGSNEDIFLESMECEFVKLPLSGSAIASNKVWKYKQLLLKHIDCYNIKTYKKYDAYTINNDGNILAKYSPGFGLTYYYIKRENDDYPKFACQIYGRNDNGESILEDPKGYAQDYRKQQLINYFEREDEIIDQINSQANFSEDYMFEYLATLCKTE